MSKHHHKEYNVRICREALFKVARETNATLKADFLFRTVTASGYQISESARKFKFAAWTLSRRY